MKRFVFFILLFSVFTFLYAQRIPSIGVISLEARGAGVSAADAENITTRIINELNSWGTVTAAQGIVGAEFIIRGTVLRQGNNFLVTGSTTNAANNQVLNEFREEVPANTMSVFNVCARAVERVPFPNYLLGTWESRINMPDGPVVCIIEFKTDRTVTVTRYDTWEHRQNNALRYEGYGAGTYTYIGYANRTINVSGQPVRIDATFGVNLSLEETLPDQTNVNISGLGIVFNADKSTFDIVNGSLPCGRNYDGPQVHPSEYLGFTRFIKTR